MTEREKVLYRQKKLFEAVKAGELEVNHRNAKAVKEAWAHSVIWTEAFKQAKLDGLQDPDELSSYQGVFEGWLVKAFRRNFKSEDETRAALLFARDKIIQKFL